ncbi:MAG: HlyC/CorC family transporter [Oligoflexia bacterium]|nr:HlyC/CorC family transporter [Oligoflexia bacterium]MBF0364373.1 HlyC/CorC family transporter [Oligoflexia bacterium]
MVPILIVLLCLLLNAIMSCAEMAFVSVDKKKIRNTSLAGDSRAAIIEKMQKVPERLLSAIQIGITLVGAISAAVSGAGAEETIAPLLSASLGISDAWAEMIAISFVVVPLTFVSVVIGELVPKSIALRYSFPVIIKLAHALKLTEKILSPLIIPMEKVTKFILRQMRLYISEIDAHHISDDVSLSGLKKEHKQYILNLIDLESKVVKGVMIPWNQVNHVLYEAESDNVLKLILEHGRTRLPVLANKEVCGFLHAKEFLHLFKSGGAENWVSFIRPPRFVKKEEKLLDVLKRMQKDRIHLLIVGDETNPEGIITLEDILEEVIGDIIDEDEDGHVKFFLRRSMITSKD